jgi:hypothetical protein
MVLDIPILLNGFGLAKGTVDEDGMHTYDSIAQNVYDFVSRGDLILSGKQKETDSSQYEIVSIYEVVNVFSVVPVTQAPSYDNVVELFDDGKTYVRKSRYPYGFMPKEHQVKPLEFPGETISVNDIILDLNRRNPFSINWQAVTNLIGTSIPYVTKGLNKFPVYCLDLD